MKYKEIKDNEEVQALIAKGNENLGVLGFTDHSETHATLVAERAAEILESLGYKKKQIELVKVAAYMHVRCRLLLCFSRNHPGGTIF